MNSTKNVHTLKDLKKNLADNGKSGKSQWSVAGFAAP